MNKKILRVIVKTVLTCPDGVVTGARFKTFDLECPEELANFLTSRAYVDVTINGCELLDVGSSKATGACKHG